MASDRKITRAIIPAAGKGTRLMPLTRSVPKEMLPLGRKPVLEHIVDETVASGIEEVLLVISEEKLSILHYFQKYPGIKVSGVIQPEQKGLGDAIRWGEEFARGEPFAVILGDSVISTSEEVSPLRRVLDTFEGEHKDGVILVQDTPIEEAYRYGMVKPKMGAPASGTTCCAQVRTAEPFEISDLVEKPKPEETPSRYAIAGRYAFHSKLFDYLRHTSPGAGQEIQLTDAVKSMLADGNTVWCVPLKAGEARRDIGTFPSYFEAFALACIEDQECGETMRRMWEEFGK